MQSFVQSFFNWVERQNSAVQAAVITAIFGLVVAIISGCFQLVTALISKPSSITITATPQAQQVTPSMFLTDTLIPDTPTPTVPPFTITATITHTLTPTEMPTSTLTPTITSEPTPEIEIGEWIIVVGGGFSTYDIAWNYLQQYKQYDHPVQVFLINNDIRTAIVGFPNQYNAEITLPKVQKQNKKAYLRKVSEWCQTWKWNSEYVECE